MSSAKKAAEKRLSALPSKVSVDWASPELPPVQLYEAVADADAPPVEAVTAHGMEGVGKWRSCQLATHRVATAESGRPRFPDVSGWVQLYRDSMRAEVHQRLCVLAATLSGSPVEPVDLHEAVERGHAALAGKFCLLVVDHVRHVRWLLLFLSRRRAESRRHPCCSPHDSGPLPETGAPVVAWRLVHRTNWPCLVCFLSTPGAMPSCMQKRQDEQVEAGHVSGAVAWRWLSL